MNLVSAPFLQISYHWKYNFYLFMFTCSESCIRCTLFTMTFNNVMGVAVERPVTLAFLAILHGLMIAIGYSDGILLAYQN